MKSDLRLNADKCTPPGRRAQARTRPKQERTKAIRRKQTRKKKHWKRKLLLIPSEIHSASREQQGVFLKKYFFVRELKVL